MRDTRHRRLWRALADWWSFERVAIGIWLFPPAETSDDRETRLSRVYGLRKGASGDVAWAKNRTLKKLKKPPAEAGDKVGRIGQGVYFQPESWLSIGGSQAS